MTCKPLLLAPLFYITCAISLLLLPLCAAYGAPSAQALGLLLTPQPQPAWVPGCRTFCLFTFWEELPFHYLCLDCLVDFCLGMSHSFLLHYFLFFCRGLGGGGLMFGGRHASTAARAAHAQRAPRRAGHSRTAGVGRTPPCAMPFL